MAVVGQYEGDGTEKTVLIVMDLPDGKEWAWLADCNVLAVSAALDGEGRERAITDCQATWRRQFIHSVPPTGAA